MQCNAKALHAMGTDSGFHCVRCGIEIERERRSTEEEV
jgi:hypothetical protein